MQDTDGKYWEVKFGWRDNQRRWTETEVHVSDTGQSVLDVIYAVASPEWRDVDLDKCSHISATRYSSDHCYQQRVG